MLAIGAAGAVAAALAVAIDLGAAWGHDLAAEIRSVRKLRRERPRGLIDRR